MKVLISHPTGNSFFRSAATGLLDAGILAGFRTTVASFPGNVFDKLSILGPFSEFKRRTYDPDLEPFSRSWPLYELGRLAASKAGFKDLVRHESGFLSVDAVYKNLDKKIALNLKRETQNGANAVYAYEDGALLSFREAKKLGVSCLYDLPIGYWRTARRLLEVERDRWPDWATTLTNLKDSPEKLDHKDEELSLADRIFVASRFTANTLVDFPGKLAPIEIIPYGFPPVTSERAYDKFSSYRPLKLLFVGGLSQRKGIADLFAAVDTIGDKVELTVVGHKATDNCKVLDEALKKHKWIPSLPHAEVLKLMRGHDVLVFPSLFEGFGMVITEAMSQGTPVITTDRTAGPDIINHGENGWLAAAGSTQALQEVIEELLASPNKIQLAGKAAMETAKLRPWTVYGKEIALACVK